MFDQFPAQAGSRVVADNPEFPPLHVLIAYDDIAAYRRAMRTLANVCCDQAEAENLRPLPWRFEEASLDTWRRQSLADARRADMIFVSMSTAGGLPPFAGRWIEECLAQRAGRPTAVMMLCEPRHPEAPARRFLRHAAAAFGLDYLETAGLPTAIAV